MADRIDAHGRRSDFSRPMHAVFCEVLDHFGKAVIQVGEPVHIVRSTLGVVGPIDHIAVGAEPFGVGLGEGSIGADVIEDDVEHQPHPTFVQIRLQALQVFQGPEAALD